LRTLTIETGIILQRRFSTFPDGWPGWGLLLLRISISAPLFYWAIGHQVPAVNSVTLALDWSAALFAVLILAGLWTPVVAILISLDQASIAISHHFALQGHLLLSALGICLAMLGPGAWSLDARRFGRNVFEVGNQDV